VPALLTSGCASGGPPRARTGETPALDEANRALEGQPATVELRSGEVARDVEGVVMTAETTSSRDGDRGRTVPTAEVARVTREVRFRVGKGLGWGLIVGVPLGFAIGSGASKRAEGIFAFSDRDATIVITDLACGLLGMVVAGILKLPPDRVAYVAPRRLGRGAPLAPHSRRRRPCGRRCCRRQRSPPLPPGARVAVRRRLPRASSAALPGSVLRATLSPEPSRQQHRRLQRGGRRVRANVHITQNLPRSPTVKQE
jgi:hypothetical protein